MRFLLLLLVLCLTLSNALHAADKCFIAMDEPQSEQMVDMPCHDTTDNTGIDHQCECENCFQSTHVSNKIVVMQLVQHVAQILLRNFLVHLSLLDY